MEFLVTNTLVERLRAPVTDGDGDCELREEAADEIERLRKALADDRALYEFERAVRTQGTGR